MNIPFRQMLPVIALAILGAIPSGAQTPPDCPASEKHFGIVVDSTAPLGVLRIAAVGTGWGGSKAGLKGGDEILAINDQNVPAGNARALTAFLNTQSVTGNTFRVKRGGSMLTLTVDKTCRPAGNADAMADLRKKLLLLVSEQSRHFAGVTGSTKLPDESIGRSVAWESSVHLFKGDFPMVKVESKPEYNYYFNRIRRDMDGPVSARLYAIWQATLMQALPDYASKKLPPMPYIPDHSVYTIPSVPGAQITLSRTQSPTRGYAVAITVSGTKDQPLDVDDLLD